MSGHQTFEHLGETAQALIFSSSFSISKTTPTVFWYTSGYLWNNMYVDMPKTIRLTINNDLENAIQVLRDSTSGTLNTTELIKMAVGEYAQIKKLTGPTFADMDDFISAKMFYKWAKEDGSLNVPNIAHPEKLKPFNPK